MSNLELSNVYDLLETLIPTNNSVEEKSEEMFYDMLYTISTTILDSRIKQNKTQKEFGKLMNVSQTMVSKWESGDYNFTIKQLCDVFAKLGLTPELKIENDNTNRKYVAKNSDIDDTSNIFEEQFSELVGAA